jgi:hypothetical protein
VVLVPTITPTSAIAIVTAAILTPAALAALRTGGWRRSLTVLAQPEPTFNVVHPVPIGRLGYLDGSGPSEELRGRLSLGLRGSLGTLRRFFHATRRTAALAAFAAAVGAFTSLAGAPTGFFTRLAFLALRKLSPRFTNFTDFTRHSALTRHGALTRRSVLTRRSALTGSTRIAIANSAAAAFTASRALPTIIVTPFLTPLFTRASFRTLRASFAARSGCRGLGRSLTDVSIQLSQAPGVLIIGRFKQLGGSLVAYQRGRSEHRRRLSSLGEQRSNLDLDGIDQHATANGGARAHGGFETRDLDHGVTRRSTGVENDVRKVLQLATIATLAATGLAMGLGDDRHDFYATALKLLGHFNRYQIASRRGGHQGGILGGKIIVTEDASGQSVDVLEEHGLPLSIGTHHEVVEAQGELHDGIEPGERSVAGPHFLNEDAAMPGAKTVHHSTGQDGLGKEARSLCDGLLLGDGRVQKTAALVKIISDHKRETIRNPHRKWMPKIDLRSIHPGVASGAPKKPDSLILPMP